MSKEETKKMLESLRKEFAWREKDNAKRPTREARGREEAFKYAGEMLDAVLDCMRWT